MVTGFDGDKYVITLSIDEIRDIDFQRDIFEGRNDVNIAGLVTGGRYCINVRVC